MVRDLHVRSMHAGIAPLEHSASLLRDWAWDPGIALPLLTTAALYGVGAHQLWSRGRRRGVRPWEVASFVSGCAVLVIALLSPLHEASEQLFAAHMIQHELLMVIAAPLLIVGKPGVVLLWGFPLRVRHIIGNLARSNSWRRLWQPLTRPFDAWLLHAAAIWCWHVPVLFQAALRNEAVHALQHLSFLGSALLFWWAIVHPRRRAALGLSIVYLFTTAIHTAILGALMTFAHTPWYPEYASRAAAWGFSPLEDQQLAGLLMWVPASFVYLVAALVILWRWLRESEWSVARAERAAVAS
jgi:putative membrane protein